MCVRSIGPPAVGAVRQCDPLSAYRAGVLLVLSCGYRFHNVFQKEHNMISRLAIAAMVAATTLVTATGCAVERHQETVGAYVDDSAVTTKVKAKFAEDKTVSAMAIKVDTMKGVVQLSGFANSREERMTAERLARETNGVQGVRNDIIVR
jgi:osmotically-inducible protein OsmY